MSDEPEILEEDDAEPLPTILVYGMGPDLLGATISMETNPDGPNVGDRYKVQLVMARDPDELSGRVVSVLVGNFGMSQEDAQAAMDAATPLSTADYVPLDGSIPMTGPLYLSADPVDAGDDSSDVLATTKHYVDMIDNLKQNTFGVIDGSDAAPNDIGAYLSQNNMAGVDMVSGAPTEICSIDLPAGCFDIWGACDFGIGAADRGSPVPPNMLASSVSLYPDALPTDDDLIVGTGVMNMIYSPIASGQRQVLTTGTCRSNSASPITLYLVAAVGTDIVTTKGYLSARRVR